MLLHVEVERRRPWTFLILLLLLMWRSGCVVGGRGGHLPLDLCGVVLRRWLLNARRVVDANPRDEVHPESEQSVELI